MQASWFCKVSGRELGPLTSQQVLDLARAQKLGPADWVRKGDSKWVLAERVKGLFPSLPGSAGASGIGTQSAADRTAPPNIALSAIGSAGTPQRPTKPLPQAISIDPDPAAPPVPAPSKPPPSTVNIHRSAVETTAIWNMNDSPFPTAELDQDHVLGETTRVWPTPEPPSSSDHVLSESAQPPPPDSAQGSATRIVRALGPGALLGNYVIVEVLGEGGMGMVLKAQHMRMERFVALKVLRTEATKSAAAIRRFHQEVKAAARLAHPNIVTAYDADEVRGAHFLVMEYVAGISLADLLMQQAPLPIKDVLSYVLQAAKGLEYAHSEGVIHRDIKPGNLLLDKRGTVKILDMGLASIKETSVAMVEAESQQASKPSRAHEPVTQEDQLLGTFDYMSPEQAEDARSVDHRTDIYSLGCTMYRLMTGRLPYAGATPMKKILAHREQPIPSLRDSRKDVSFEIDGIFRRMVAKKPDARYASMTALIADLEAYLSNRPLQSVGLGMETGPAPMSGSRTSVGRLDSGAAIVRPILPPDDDDTIRLAEEPSTASPDPKPASQMERWYWKVMGEEMGPFTVKQLARKKLSRDDMVRREGSSLWIQASEVEGLF